jgi:hypothetical protein
MIIRWISDVPSKMVKILAIWAVYAGQRPAAPRGISTDSARPVRDEFRFLVGPVRDWRAGRRRASVGGRGRPVSWRMPSAGYSAKGTSQVHSRADLRLSRRSRYRPRVRGADGPDAGRTPGECPNPGLAAVTPTRRHHRPDRPYTPALATMPYGANAQRGPDLERACPRRRQWYSVPRARRAGGDVCCPAVGGGR